MELYNDGWCVIVERDDNGICFYADRSCTSYIELTKTVALHIIKKMKENQERGYGLIDYIHKKRINGGSQHGSMVFM